MVEVGDKVAIFNSIGKTTISPLMSPAVGDKVVVANDMSGKKIAIKAGTGVPCPRPGCDFSADITEATTCQSPVTFTDHSTRTPTAWLWDFGDGTGSTLQNPVHSYTSTGVFNVTLTVTNACGSTTLKKWGYITVTAILGTFIYNRVMHYPTFGQLAAHVVGYFDDFPDYMTQTLAPSGSRGWTHAAHTLTPFGAVGSAGYMVELTEIYVLPERTYARQVDFDISWDGGKIVDPAGVWVSEFALDAWRCTDGARLRRHTHTLTEGHYTYDLGVNCHNITFVTTNFFDVSGYPTPQDMSVDVTNLVFS